MFRDRSLVVTLACVFTFGGSSAAFAAIDLPDNFSAQTIVTGFDQPLGLAFLPDGRLLVTEQHTGYLRLVVGDHIAAHDPVLVVPSFNGSGYERGLQSVAVDPGWPDRPYIYLVYNRTGNFLRLVRYTAYGDVNSRGSEHLDFRDPMILIDDMPDDYHNHNGGTLLFGPDGYLYLSIGDDTDNCAAQDSTRLKGNVLRIDVSRLPGLGAGPVARSLITPPTSPLATSNPNAKLVYAYGMRNPWRFEIDPATGLLYLGDVGEGTYEELDEVAAGNNLGWPYREGTQQRDAGSCTEPGGMGHGKYKSPIVTLNHSTGVAAILAVGVYRGKSGMVFRWPSSYEGDLFYSDYFTGFIRRLKKVSGTWTTPAAVSGQPNSSDWATGFTSPVDFAQGPDGSFWMLSQWDAAQSPASGSLVRIAYIGAATDVPASAAVAVTLEASPNPFVGATDLAFTLPQAGPATLAVYDVHGRRLRTLWKGWTHAGRTELSWDGRDDRGRAVPPGMYLARMERLGATESTRLLRVR